MARALGVGFRDTDRDVEAEAGCSVADVFVSQGSRTSGRWSRRSPRAGRATVSWRSAVARS